MTVQMVYKVFGLVFSAVCNRPCNGGRCIKPNMCLCDEGSVRSACLPDDLRDSYNKENEKSRLSVPDRFERPLTAASNSGTSENSGIATGSNDGDRGNGYINRGTGDINRGYGDNNQGNSDINRGTGDINRRIGDINRGNGDMNRGTGDTNRGNGDINQRNGDINRGNGDINRGNGDINRGIGDINRGNGDINRGNGDIDRQNGDINQRNGEINRGDGDNNRGNSDSRVTAVTPIAAASRNVCKFPCLNGGTCQGSVCACRQGYNGENCADRE